MRRDKRGRRIGYNWWRVYNCEALAAAEAAWQSRRESGEPINTDAVAGASYDTAYYQLTEAEYRALHPRPNLKDFLLQNAGMACHNIW